MVTDKLVSSFHRLPSNKTPRENKVQLSTQKQPKVQHAQLFKKKKVFM